MKEFSIIKQEPTEAIANEFKNSFSYYVDEIKINIDKEKDDFFKEEYTDYLKFIEQKAGISKKVENTYSNRMNIILKDKVFSHQKSHEIDSLFKLYKNKMKFESETIDNRNMYKSLDILNETHASLIKSLTKLKKDLNDNYNWLDIFYDNEYIYSTVKNQMNEEKIHANVYKGEYL